MATGTVAAEAAAASHPARAPGATTAAARARLLRAAAWTAIAAALAAGFFAYRSPERMVELANQVWACF